MENCWPVHQDKDVEETIIVHKYALVQKKGPTVSYKVLGASKLQHSHVVFSVKIMK